MKTKTRYETHAACNGQTCNSAFSCPRGYGECENAGECCYPGRCGARSTIPVESLRGSVFTQLYHGQPLKVFVEDRQGLRPYAVCLVREVAGAFVPVGPRYQRDWPEHEDPQAVVAAYLAQVDPN